MTYKDFNNAKVEDLVKFKGVGPVLAKRIMDRASKYPFTRNEDLLKVKGLGKKTLEKLGIKVESKTRVKKVELVGHGNVNLSDGYAKDARDGKIDWMWRIPQEHRIYFLKPETLRKIVKNVDINAIKDDEVIQVNNNEKAILVK